MTRLAKILTLMLVVASLAAPAALAKPLQPTLPPDARDAPAAQGTADSADVPAIAVAGGIAVLLLGVAIYPRRSGRHVPAPC